MEINKLIEILRVIEPYSSDGYIGGADHDVIMLLPPGVEPTEEDKKKLLEELDVLYDEHERGWYVFV